ncbi:MULTISPECIES: hypothetical protein [Bacillaceae]|nr:MULTISPECIES: hypothetical protein [Bacillaceae]
MAKHKHTELKDKKAMPKTDQEFAQNGLEKIALRAQKSQLK